jgi:cysteinyl-tRNA synthetase
VEKQFFAAVADDLNTPKALAVLWKFIRAYRKARTKHPAAAHALFLKFDTILGMGLRDIKLVSIPAFVQHLVEKREEARQKKHWLEADSIREELKKKGWEVRDTPEGSLVTRV